MYAFFLIFLLSVPKLFTMLKHRKTALLKVSLRITRCLYFRNCLFSNEKLSVFEMKTRSF